VTELGEVLELLHGSAERWRTIRVSGTEWRDEPLLREAFRRDMPVVRRPPSGSGFSRSISVSAGGGFVARVDGAEDPHESVEPWRYWQDGARQRAEFRSSGDETVVVVYEGDTYWSWSPSDGARTNGGRQNERHGLGPGPALLDTMALLSTLRFASLGRTELLGRSVIEVAAEPRPAPHLMMRMALHALGQGADQYRLLLDAERGVLLRSEARLRDRPFRVIEVTEVSFDEDFPESTFRVELTEGEEFDETVEFEATTLEELPSLVPFEIFVPADLGRALVQVSRRRRDDGRRIVDAMITCFVGERRIWLQEVAQADWQPWENDETWEQRGDITVHEAHAADHVRCKVRLAKEGTAILMESTGATLDELIAIARSLRSHPR
jgi:hypothetical protein